MAERNQHDTISDTVYRLVLALQIIGYSTCFSISTRLNRFSKHALVFQ
jgi:hypothetical protein